jgi:hypothetical protein
MVPAVETDREGLLDAQAEELAARLDAVERRLTMLEHAEGGRPSSAPAETESGAQEETFWVLDGLRERLAAGEGAVLAGVVPLPTGEQYAWQYGRTTQYLLAASWQELSKAIAALGHPVRLRLLQLILTGTRSAADLQTVDGLGTSGQLYHHLRQLIAAGWLAQSARGHYAVPGSRVIPLLVLLTATENEKRRP